MITLFPCLSSRPKETINECAGRVVKNDLVTVKFGNREYKVTVNNNSDVTVTRQNKTWYKSVEDILSRGFTRGQQAFTPRALQLQTAIQAEFIKTQQEKTGRFAGSLSIQPGAVKSASTFMPFSAAEIIKQKNTLQQAPSRLKLDFSSINKKDDVKKQATELAFRLNSFNAKLNEQLEKAATASSSKGEPGPWLSPETGRFRDIKACAATATFPGLHANKISVRGKAIAIACQYPKTEQLDRHLRMLADNKTPCLVILAGEEEIKGSSASRACLPDYFSDRNPESVLVKFASGKKDYINLGKAQESVAGTKQQNETEHLIAKFYNLNVMDSGNNNITVPVIHVTNWPDKKTIPAETLKNLIGEIDTVVAAKKKQYSRQGLNNAQGMLPVIHCKAGVGRTGMVIAGYAMRQDQQKKLTLEGVIREMRESRNSKMVQTDEQLKTLVEHCNNEGYNVLRSEK